MNVELQDMRWAIVASQYRSLRKAAETLNVRQSTLSRRLADLEYRFGSSFFERTNGGTRPTPAGQEFIEIARRILDASDAAFTRLKQRYSDAAGGLTVGVYSALSTGNLHSILAEYHRRFPAAIVRVVDGRRDDLLCDLSSSGIDVLIMTDVKKDWQERKLDLWSERVIVALPKSHLLAAKPLVHWRDLTNEQFLMARRGPGPEFLGLLTDKLGKIDCVEILHQDIGIDRLLSLVSAGYGALLILEGATGARYEGVSYLPVHGDDGVTRLNFAAYWRRANQNPALQPFLALVRERYPDLSVEPPS